MNFEGTIQTYGVGVSVIKQNVAPARSGPSRNYKRIPKSADFLVDDAVMSKSKPLETEDTRIMQPEEITETDGVSEQSVGPSKKKKKTTKKKQAKIEIR